MKRFILMGIVGIASSLAQAGTVKFQFDCHNFAGASLVKGQFELDNDLLQGVGVPYDDFTGNIQDITFSNLSDFPKNFGSNAVTPPNQSDLIGAPFLGIDYSDLALGGGISLAVDLFAYQDAVSSYYTTLYFREFFYTVRFDKGLYKVYVDLPRDSHFYASMASGVRDISDRLMNDYGNDGGSSEWKPNMENRDQSIEWELLCKVDPI